MSYKTEFDPFICRVCGDTVNTYKDLILKIRESSSSDLNIEFSRGDEKTVTCVLDCNDGGKNEIGAQLTLKEIKVNSEPVWPVGKGGYNYPCTKRPITNIKTALYNISNNKETAQAETSLIFMLCDAARSIPCEQIAIDINNGNVGTNIVYKVGSGEVHKYVNGYDKCYKCVYGKSPSEIKPKERKVLTKLDYDIFDLLSICKNSKEAECCAAELSKSIHNLCDKNENIGFVDKEEKRKLPEKINSLLEKMISEVEKSGNEEVIEKAKEKANEILVNSGVKKEVEESVLAK